VTTIKLRTGTTSQWTKANPVLLLGEPGYDSDTHILKVGNGSTPWMSLKGYLNETTLAATYAPGGTAGTISMVDLGDAIAGEVDRANAEYAENPDQIWVPASDFWPLTGTESWGYGGLAVHMCPTGFFSPTRPPRSMTAREARTSASFRPTGRRCRSRSIGPVRSHKRRQRCARLGVRSSTAFPQAERSNPGHRLSPRTTPRRHNGRSARDHSTARCGAVASIDPAQLNRIMLYRNATSGNDTIVGDVLFLGVMVRRVA
jgi:hypothetical protein